MKYILFLLLLNIFNCIAAQPAPDIEKQAVFMVKKMFDQIIDKKIICRTDEEYYFGDNGGILGESLYSSLNSIYREKTMDTFIKTGKSPLGILLSHKLYPLLQNKKRFSFALASNIRTIDNNNISRTGINATLLLFVRAIPETEGKFFHDIGNGINFVFALNYTSNKKTLFALI